MNMSFREFVQSPGQNAVSPSVTQQTIQQNRKPFTPIQTQNDKNKDPALDPVQWAKGGKVDALKSVRDLTDKLNKNDPKNPAAQQLKRMQGQLDLSLANAAKGFTQWNMQKQAKQTSQGQKSIPQINTRI